MCFYHVDKWQQSARPHVWLKTHYIPTSNIGASLPASQPKGCFLTSGPYQLDGNDITILVPFLPFSYFEGGWESFHKHTGHLNSIFLWLLSMSSVLFPMCRCPLTVDLSKTLTYNRMSSSVCRLVSFLSLYWVFWVLLWFLPQDQPSLPAWVTFLSFISHHLFCMCSFLLHLGELLELI